MAVDLAVAAAVTAAAAVAAAIQAVALEDGHMQGAAVAVAHLIQDLVRLPKVQPVQVKVK
jgi:hypothetical protein